MKIFVGNLSWDANDDSLRQLFEAYGEVVSVRVVQDPYTGRSKGFGFVEMKDEASCAAAIAGLNEHDFLGRPLRVSRAQEQGERTGGGAGGYRGGDRGDRGGSDRGGYRGGERGGERSSRPSRSRYEES